MCIYVVLTFCADKLGAESFLKEKQKATEFSNGYFPTCRDASKSFSIKTRHTS